MDTKKCSKCFIEKPLSDFHKRNDRPLGAVPRCKKCKSKYAKQWNIKNKEKLHKYYLLNIEKYREADKRYKEKNRERVNSDARDRRAENPNLSRIACEKWRRNNLDKDAKRAQDYRSAKINAKPIWANDKYMNLWYKFAKIEEERTGRRVHVDHIIPLRGETVCGLHCEHNMQLLFGEDNESKGNRWWFC